MEECTSVHVGQNETTERTGRRQEQEFRMALKGCGLAGLGRRQGNSVGVCWAGNQCVKERRGQVSESQACCGGLGSRGSGRKLVHQGGG
jgi:hypothetical protein